MSPSAVAASMGVKRLQKYYERTGEFNQMVLEIVSRLFDLGNNQIPRILHVRVKKNIWDQ